MARRAQKTPATIVLLTATEHIRSATEHSGILNSSRRSIMEKLIDLGKASEMTLAKSGLVSDPDYNEITNPFPRYTKPM
jgi:hypothetical protein